MIARPKILNHYVPLLAILVAAALSSPITVGYWGQKSSDAERDLLAYCSESNWDVINVAFLSEFGSSAASVDLAGHTATSCANNNDCSSVGTQIKTCQQTYGKKILLSLGGSQGGYSLSSNAQAISVADELWSKFLGGNGPVRPFGPDATFDGIDLDIERTGQATYYTTLVNRLRNTYFAASSRPYYVSAAPQCPFPDAALGPDSGTTTGTPLSASKIDWVNVQFYNNGFDQCNGCNIFGNNYAARVGQWAEWAASKQTAFLIGAPGAAGARFADSSTLCQGGFVSASTLKQALGQACSAYSSFGGLMIFDVGAEEESGGSAYISDVTSYVHGLSCGVNPLGSTTTTTTTATSPTTSTSTTTTTTTTTSTSTTSSPTSTSSPCGTPSGPPPTGSCPTSGSMQCYGSNYVTCANNQWGPVQQCGAGTACSQSGPYIYCLTSQCGSTPTTTATTSQATSTTTSQAPSTTTSSQPCTNGNMRCTGQATYSTCTNGQWSSNQSCQSGLRCSSSGDYVYCIQ